MPLKFQSHWRLINTWLKARLGQVWGLALPLGFEGFHTLGHGVSLNKSSLIISAVDGDVNWHAADQRDMELFWYVCLLCWLFCLMALRGGFCTRGLKFCGCKVGRVEKNKHISKDYCENTGSWVPYSRLYWSFKVLLSRSGKIISRPLFFILKMWMTVTSKLL